MDANAKKTALRMIPYGLFVLTGQAKDGRVAAATVNWVTQASFEPPLVVVAVKADSHAHGIIKESKAFALNILGKNHKDVAYTFFKPLEREGNTADSGKTPGFYRMRPGRYGRARRSLRLRGRSEGRGRLGRSLRPPGRDHADAEGFGR